MQLSRKPLRSWARIMYIFLPYLMGERSPHNDPNARGTFIGMTMDTTRADMTQAVLEGVAFALRDSLEVAKSLGIHIERTKICGGGAKSPLWRKIIANVMNLKVDMIESEEGPALGGAMLAAVACGEYKNVEEAAEKLVKVTGTVEPDPELAAKYEEKYQQFKQIYPACKPLFEIIKYKSIYKIFWIEKGGIYNGDQEDHRSCISQIWRKS